MQLGPENEVWLMVLVQEGSDEQDGFEVFSNVTARQLFHANGSL